MLNSEEVYQLKDVLYRMKADPDLEAKRIYTRHKGDHLGSQGTFTPIQIIPKIRLLSGDLPPDQGSESADEKRS